MEQTQQDIQEQINSNATHIRRQAKLTAANAYQRLNLARDQWFLNKIDIQALIHSDKGYRELIDLYIEDIRVWYELSTEMSNKEEFTSQDLEKLTATEKRGLASSEAIQIMQAQMKELEQASAPKGKGAKSNKRAFQQAREYARSMGVNLTQEEIANKAKVVQDAQELASHGLDNDPFILKFGTSSNNTNEFISFGWEIEEINEDNDLVRKGMRPGGLERLGTICQTYIKQGMSYEQTQRALGDVYRELHKRFGVARGMEVTNPQITGELNEDGSFTTQLEVMVNQYSFREHPKFGFKVVHELITDAEGTVISIDNNVGSIASRLTRTKDGDDRTSDALMPSSMMLSYFHKINIGDKIENFEYDWMFIRNQRVELESITDLVLNKARYGTIKDDSTGNTSYVYEFYFIPSKYFEAYGAFAATRQDDASVEKDLDAAFEQAKLLGEDKTTMQDSVAMDRAEKAASSAATLAMKHAIQ